MVRLFLGLTLSTLACSAFGLGGQPASPPTTDLSATCVVGTWEQDPDEAHRILTEIVSGMGTVTDVSGSRYLVITPEGEDTPGQISLFPRDACATIVVDGRVSRGCVSGMTTADYTMVDETHMSVSNQVVNLGLTMTTADGAIEIAVPSDGASSEIWEVECTETTFTSFTGGRAPFETSTYRRTSPVPTPEPPEDVEGPGGPGAGGDPPGGLPVSSACEALTIGDFVIGTDEVSWTLNNASFEAAEISRVSLDWPGGNGAWQSISLAGTEIWSGSQAASPAVVETGWRGAADERTVLAGGDVELALGFLSSAATSGYIVVVDFANGCLLSSVE